MSSEARKEDARKSLGKYWVHFLYIFIGEVMARQWAFFVPLTSTGELNTYHMQGLAFLLLIDTCNPHSTGHIQSKIAMNTKHEEVL